MLHCTRNVLLFASQDYVPVFYGFRSCRIPSEILNGSQSSACPPTTCAQNLMFHRPCQPLAAGERLTQLGENFINAATSSDDSKIGGQVCAMPGAGRADNSKPQPSSLQTYCKNCRCFQSTLVPFTEALVGKLQCHLSTFGMHTIFTVSNITGSKYNRKRALLRGQLLQKRLSSGRPTNVQEN